ncbi:MAG TPA: extracellular solute-binding protein, partial [Candidatus Paceibacterota bacterium]|nr:extracellular solute-binding protein [Candidatus Paceibacterota bacterium]
GNHELPKMQNKLVALSPVDFPNFTITQFRADFPQAAEEDLVSNGQIYAMPLYMDTLALIYNRDLFDQAGIVSPPATWSDFQTDVAALRQVGANGQIARAAAAIGGTGKTVDHATDILELLMMQNGATMTSADLTTATFAQTTQESGSSGATAFNFYLQFANATSPYYTWNEGQTDSIDSFAAGQTAMIFDYQSALATIKNKAPFLNFAVAPMPQVAPDNAVNFPSYEALAVSKQSKDQFHAWDFAIYAATNGESATMYAGHRPPALRAAIAVNENNPDFGIFAKQALTARSWYEADDAQINDIMNGAIRDVLVGAANSNTALGQAEAQVSQLMKGNQ